MLRLDRLIVGEHNSRVRLADPSSSAERNAVRPLRRSYALLLLCAATAITLPAQTFTTLHNFDGTDGKVPIAGLVQATNGNLYGTTGSGGANGDGTIFKITPSGTLMTIYSFCPPPNRCTDGAYPVAGLIQGTDGNFYGTTSEGGANSHGTVFKISPSGMLATLHSFCSESGCADGQHPSEGLVQATDGNFYGTTYSGGAYGFGTVFTISPSGTLATLHSFCSGSGCTDGQYPSAGLVQAIGGNLYGTTYDGGASGEGTVFKITPSGDLTTLHSFDSTDGYQPSGALVQATGGNFYGTTTYGGASNLGTIFKITASGTLTTLHNFDSTDGAEPCAGLIQAADGNFYGTTTYGGTSNFGTVFKITASGNADHASQLRLGGRHRARCGAGPRYQWDVLRDNGAWRCQQPWDGFQPVCRAWPVCGNTDHLRAGRSGRQDSGD
jgi:uncharacterized repeat protein (TIGR03803 family)